MYSIVRNKSLSFERSKIISEIMIEFAFETHRSPTFLLDVEYNRDLFDASERSLLILTIVDPTNDDVKMPNLYEKIEL